MTSRMSSGSSRCDKLGRADEVDEHHGELPPLCAGIRGGWRWRSCPRAGSTLGEGRNGAQQLAPMADRRDPERSQVLGGQLGKNLGINVIVAEGRCVLAQAEALPAMPQYPRAFSQAVEALLTGHYIANRKQVVPLMRVAMSTLRASQARSSESRLNVCVGSKTLAIVDDRFAPHVSHSCGPVRSPKADVAIADAAGSFAPLPDLSARSRRGRVFPPFGRWMPALRVLRFAQGRLCASEDRRHGGLGLHA